MSKEDMKKLHSFWRHVKEGYSYKELKNLLKGFVILEESTYFNILSRYFYFFLFYLYFPIPHKIKMFLCDVVSRTEKYIKLGGIEHLIVYKRF